MTGALATTTIAINKHGHLLGGIGKSAAEPAALIPRVSKAFEGQSRGRIVAAGLGLDGELYALADR